MHLGAKIPYSVLITQYSSLIITHNHSSLITHHSSLITHYSLLITHYSSLRTDIKRGDWPLDKVKSEAERLFQLAQEAYVRSPLPPEPDRERAERLCVEMISEYHKLGVA